MASMGVAFVVPRMTLMVSCCTLSSLSKLDCDRVVRPRENRQRQRERQTDRQTDRQTHRQTERDKFFIDKFFILRGC